MSDSSGASAPHHGHEWVVIVFNLLSFFGGQLAPRFHDLLATALKAYTGGILGGVKYIAQGLLVSEVDLAAGLLGTWGGRASAKPTTYGRYFVFKCPKCGLISASTLSAPPQNQLFCLRTGHPPPLRGCGYMPTFNKTICKVGLRPIKEGDAPLTMTEGFKDLTDTVEAVREMREAQAGGVLATVEEQEELEAALEEEAGGGGGGGGGGAAAAAASAASFQAAAAAAAEDVEVVLSQQLEDMSSPSKPPAPKKPKKGGDGGGEGGSASQAIELSQ